MMIIDSKMTASVMDVFIKRKMLCAGCPAESFHTLEDVAHIYDIALTQLLKELQGVINAKGDHERIR